MRRRASWLVLAAASAEASGHGFLGQPPELGGLAGSGLALAAVDALVGDGLSLDAEATYKLGDMCHVLEHTPEDKLQYLLDMNCRMVDKAAVQLTPFAHNYSKSNEGDWMKRIAAAEDLCRKARRDKTNLREATAMAIQAWGNHLMQGRECCEIVGPPFCVVASGKSRMGHFLPFVVSCCLMIVLALTNWLPCCRKVGVRHADGVDVPEKAHPSRPPPGASPYRTEDADNLEIMKRRMMEYFRRQSLCDLTSNLPGREDTTLKWVDAAASLFVKLHSVFGFQAQSTMNQFEHFLSLWRDEVCQEADSLQDGRRAHHEHDWQANLMRIGLKGLHEELLDGFEKYKVRMEGVHHVPDHDSYESIWKPSLPGDAGGSPLAENVVGRSRLAEVITFLLVWGEAGNLRFMPEVLYFITDQVLRADVSRPGRLYPSMASKRDLTFLSRVVRPLYNYVFNTTYTKVDVKGDPNTGADAKVMHPGFDKYMPNDLANYDDWTELFCDADRLKAALVLKSDTEEGAVKFFSLEPSMGFAHLNKIDWVASLKGCKTHKEVHSLWGFFKATHRIIFLHTLLFLATMIYVASGPKVEARRDVLLLGRDLEVRFAALGLLIPVHVIAWQISEWTVAGPGTNTGCVRILWVLASLIVLPTYAAVRMVEVGMLEEKLKDSVYGGHAAVCGLLAVGVLCFPHLGKPNPVGALTPPSFGSVILRWLFWGCIFGVKGYLSILSLQSLDTAMRDLNITRFGLQSVTELPVYLFSPSWDKDMIIWAILFSTGYLLYVSDTQFWFSLGCSILGVMVAIYQRSGQLLQLFFMDKMARVYTDPRNAFWKQVLYYSPGQVTALNNFRALWDRIIDWMRYEDKLDNIMAGNLSFYEEVNMVKAESDYWEDVLTKPIDLTQCEDDRTPSIFEPSSLCDRWLARGSGILEDANFPTNAELRWRLAALSRAVAFQLPRPYWIPYIPGLTVVVPHYGETILMQREELFDKKKLEQEQKDASNGLQTSGRDVPLMSFLQYRYPDEYAAFTNRMAALKPIWHNASTRWDRIHDSQWPDLCKWASMRSQTLWRTIAGMTMYHQALQAHYELQGNTDSPMYRRWKPNECFTCLVSMQMYAFFKEHQLLHTNAMFRHFEDSLKVAFIDKEFIGDGGKQNAQQDEIHPNQKRRYFSCLLEKDKHGIDASEHAERDSMGRLRQRPVTYKVELPGFPILGDGKGDNQNHAIIFTRGTFVQCIDANQGAYFEQMLLLPCVLGEFRRGENSRSGSRKIVGFPEHITSDIGTIGDFAAGAETAFGTILQRSYAVLGGRMHYGHPDMMNKVFMIQQGGVSKATKTVNLSEDIFAGMDFTLRGDGRTIQHTEYFHLSKGRDLGFGTVLVFFAKLSSGTGEQALTRQMARLGEQLRLPEFCTFYYAHAGFYLTQFFLSKCIPLLVYVWLLCVADSADPNCTVMDPDPEQTSGNDVMLQFLVTQFSHVMVTFLVAGIAPLILELMIEGGVILAVKKLLVTLCTFSPLHFVFQAKIIGSYMSNELLFGGAGYMATGRGLPTERRCFISYNDKKKGLYNDYAQFALHDGAKLLASCLLVIAVTGIPDRALFWWCVALSLNITSWLFAPFIYNPYQYKHDRWFSDLCDWTEHFTGARISCFKRYDPEQFSSDAGKRNTSLQSDWEKWYVERSLKPNSGIRTSPGSIALWALFLASWYTVLNSKVHILKTVLSSSQAIITQVFPLVPPTVCSFVACVLVVCKFSDVARADPDPDPQNPRKKDEELSPEELSARASHAALIRNVKYGMAYAVVLLDCGEGFFGLARFVSFGWHRGVVAGIMLKYAWMSMLLALAESLFRLNRKPYNCSNGHKFTQRKAEAEGYKCKQCQLAHIQEDDIKPAETCVCCKEPPRGTPQWHLEEALYLWMTSHRMARDILVSSIIFWSLSLGVAFDFVRVRGCRISYGLHNLLVYRDPAAQTNRVNEMILPQQRSRLGSMHVETSTSRRGADRAAPRAPDIELTGPRSPPRSPRAAPAAEPPRSPRGGGHAVRGKASMPKPPGRSV